MGNAYDPEHEISFGRGNLSFTSINLPRIAIRSKGSLDWFFEELERFQPAMAAAFAAGTPEEYAALQNLSIDYGLLEVSERVAVGFHHVETAGQALPLRIQGEEGLRRVDQPPPLAGIHRRRLERRPLMCGAFPFPGAGTFRGRRALSKRWHLAGPPCPVEALAP